ncbi:MAG: GntR family transcriptional regulator, partial [Pseudomonadaceae bacterium]
MTLYLNLAELLGTRIEQGLYRPGDRLPSVRSLSQEHGVSLSTVQQAYRHLEDMGLASPRPKSGYFVPLGRQMPALPHKIQIAPGSIFSAAGKYRNCIRLNYAEPPSDVI